jgi:hypothetical protein
MDRKDDGHVPSERDSRHRPANPCEPAVEAFAAVTRHQDHSFVRGETSVEELLDPRSQLRPAVQQSGHPQQGVDPGIAGHDDPVATNSFVQKIFARPRGRGEVKIGHLADEPAIDLLGPRSIDVVGAQAGLDMRHWNSVVERCKRTGKGRGRVPLHDDPIRVARRRGPR